MIRFLLYLLGHLLYLEKRGKPGEWEDRVASPVVSGYVDVVALVSPCCGHRGGEAG